jgi:hypothetical protein
MKHANKAFMKTLILFVFYFLSSFISFGQTAAAEAKAAYLLAEEAFATNDWKGTLSYLDECKKKIGTPNSKILYLQIMAEMELAKTDSTYNEAVLKTIAAFEKAPDVKKFNEDKSLEVMKAKIRLTRIQEQAAKEKLAREERAKWMKTLGGTIVTEKDGHGLIMANQDIGKMTKVAAFKACRDLVLNGQNDWRLPTDGELLQMININNQLKASNQRPAEFILMAGIYWDADSPIITSVLNKKALKQEHNVRPVRSF